MITCGGFSALLLGAAACLTGKDPDKIEALPHPTWPRSECLIQTAQTIRLRSCVSVGGRDDRGRQDA